MVISGRRRRWPIVVLVLLVALVAVAIVGYAGYALVAGSADLIRPARSADCRTPAFAYGWAYEAINYDQSTDAALRPVEDPPGSGDWQCDGSPAPAGREVVSSDGVRLAGWYVPAAGSVPPSGRTLILVHGRSSNKSEYLRYAVPLHQAFNIVLVDVRDAGQSDRADETMGVREAGDVEAFVNWLVRTKAPAWIGVVGTSQGGAASLEAAAGDPRIRAVVLDSTHSRIGGTVARGIEQDRHLPAFPAQAAAFFGAWLRTGIDLSSVDPVEVIPRLGTRPLLLVHGALDTYDPPLDSVRLNYQAALTAGVPVEIHVCAGAGHDDVIDACPTEWAEWVTAFLLRAASS
jgi:pimeloyl-ACP methyl ester carboxylesterase